MTEQPESACGHPVAEPSDARPEPPSVADLRLLRERGLVRIRHTELAALRRAVSLSPTVPAEGAEGCGARAIEAMLRAAVTNLGARPTGCRRGTHVRPQPRRPGPACRGPPTPRRAAQAYGVSQERFRKHHERIVIEQVAEEILELCQPAADRAHSDAVQPELARQIRMEGNCGTARFPVTVHVAPVELLRDIDVVVAPTNVYLETPQPYQASVSRLAP